MELKKLHIKHVKLEDETNGCLMAVQFHDFTEDGWYSLFKSIGE
jgi:hypothetical protein